MRNLRTLVIAGFPDPDFVTVSVLTRLQYLSVLHFPAATDLSPLADLKDLRILRLQSLPSWDSSGKVIEVDSLAPLAELPRLEHLELFGVRPADRSLRPLESAPALRTVRVSKFPKAEVARYRAVAEITDDFAPSPSETWD